MSLGIVGWPHVSFLTGEASQLAPTQTAKIECAGDISAQKAAAACAAC